MKVSRACHAAIMVAALVVALPKVSAAQGEPAATPAPAAPISVVVLSPRIDAGDSRAEAAGLLCDALAELLSKDADLTVVDRGQIARILEEHRIRLGSGEPATHAGTLIAYDMMARLTFDTVRPLPQVRIELIELSTGNALETGEFDWDPQPGESQLARMAQLTRSAARKAAAAMHSRKLKVRILGVANASSTPRAEPLAAEFAQMLERTVEANPDCRLVHHIEAATAGEESLLILMGLSKPGGGRVFAPAADVTVEASIREIDPQGKEFLKTPLKVTFRTTAAGRPDSGWKAVTGIVEDWPAVSAKACAEAAGEIASRVPEHLRADPQAAVKMIDDMTRRRVQARAELGAALRATYKGSPEEKWKALLEHVAAARKLDPLCEEAAFAYAMLCNGLFPDSRAGVPGLQSGQVDRMAGLAEGMKYLERFKGPAEHRRTMLYIIFPSVNWTIGAQRVTEILDDSSKITAEELRMLDALKRHTDLAMRDFPPASYGMTTIPLVCIGMERAGVPASQRWDYVRWVLKRCEEGPAVNDMGCPAEKQYLWLNYWGALRLAVMEKQTDQAAAMLDKLLASAPRNDPGFQKYTMPQIRAMVQAGKDERLIARLGTGAAAPKPTAAGAGDFLGIESPKIAVFDASKAAAAPRATPLAVSCKPLDPKNEAGFLPLLRTDGRLYVLVVDLTPAAQGQSHLQNLMHIHTLDLGEVRVAYLELDDDGSARGELHVLEMPRLDKRLDITTAAPLAGKVYFGTCSCGILELTENSGRWRTLGLADGLPVNQVRSLLRLDDKTVLGNGGRDWFHNFTLFTVDTEGQFKLLRAGALPKDRVYGGASLAGAWRQDGKIIALEETGLWTDLGGPAEKFTNAYSFGVGAMRAIADRHWVWGYDTLVAMDDVGKTVRTWRSGVNIFGSTSGGWSNLSICGIGLRGEIPMLGDDRYESMCNDDSHLFFYRDGHVPVGRQDAMLCYEPASDTWYGPLSLARPPWTVVGTKNGLWIGDAGGLSWMKTDDFKAAAAEAGRVTTSTDLKKRQEELYLALPPFERAKYYLAKKDLSKVTALLEPILKGKPDDPEALLMMGFAREMLAHEPQEALEWYGKLAALEGNRPARLTGLAAMMSVKNQLKEYDEVLRLGRQIEQEFPSINFGYGGKGYAFREMLDNARRQSAPRSSTTERR